MSNLSQSITSLCHQLIEKPTNIKVNSDRKYQKNLEKSLNDSALPQEIVLSKISSDFYIHLKHNICINLFKELSIEPSFNDIDKEVYVVLHEADQIINDDGRYHVAMQDGDIEIKFGNSAISEKISEHKYIQKTGAIIKGEDCFIEKCSPGGRDSDHYSLVQSTQEELKEILIGLTGLL